MKKTARWGAAALILAGAAGTALIPAASASAAVLPPPPGFVCPTGSDTINVPSTLTGANQPALAGTVCVFAGTTAFRAGAHQRRLAHRGQVGVRLQHHERPLLRAAS